MSTSIKDRIEIQLGDITQLSVDAIVNAANRSLLGGGGVDGAIHRAAGPELLQACQKLNGCLPGEAKMTQGYNLNAQYVIHTVGPIYRNDPDDPKILASCYRNSIRLATTYRCRTVAFPAISCGAYGYPIKAASRIAIDSVIAELSSNSAVNKVIFILFAPDYVSIYEHYLRQSECE